MDQVTYTKSMFRAQQWAEIMHPENLDELMPWAPAVQDECKL